MRYMPILIETPVQRASRENWSFLLNTPLDFVLGHLHWWPYVVVAGLVLLLLWRGRK